MSDERTPVDTALDLLIFAPVGLAMAARDALPELVERGRERVTSQATMARMIGQFAVQQGQVRAGKALDDARGHAVTVLEQLAGQADDVAPAGGAAPATSNGSTPPTPVVAVDAPAAESASAETAPALGPMAQELAVPDYDSLAASQVVPRLSGLSPEELEAVRAYEAGHRARKTILSRIAQLQGSR